MMSYFNHYKVRGQGRIKPEADRKMTCEEGAESIREVAEGTRQSLGSCSNIFWLSFALIYMFPRIYIERRVQESASAHGKGPSSR